VKTALFRNERKKFLFLINGMLAVINVDPMIKNDLKYRATKDLHEIVTPQAVALCYLWLKLWVPFELQRQETTGSKETQEASEESSDVSSLTDGNAEKERKKRGRIKGNPSYLNDESKADYKKILGEVSENLKIEKQRVSWNDWWKRRMEQVIVDNEKNMHHGKKRKRDTEEKSPLLPSGAEITQLMAV